MELSKKDEVLAELDKFVYTVDYQDLGENATAYTLKNINEYVGRHYRIYIDNKNEELEPFYLMHEGGHIIFGHVRLNKVQELNNKNKFRAVFPKFAPYFKGSKYTPEEIYFYFENHIFNMIMDWEINSKFYTDEEWDYFTSIIGGGCHPKDMDYPSGLSWGDYLNLILQDPDKFMQKMKDQMQQQGQGQGDGQGQGQGQSQDDSTGSGSGSSSDGSGNGETNAQAIDRMLDQMKKEMEQSAEHKAEEEKIQKEEDKMTKAPGTGPNKSETGSVNQHLEGSYKDMESLKKVILDHIYSKVQVKVKTDNLYNYNRRRYGTSVLIPKRVEQKVIRNNGLVVILDVSGSVSSEKVYGFVKVFREISKKLGKKCSLVLWNTDFVQEISADDENTELFIGGGTQIDKGIEYVKDNKKYNDSTLFVVSDFEDNLDRWVEVQYPKKMYGICWDSYSYKNNVENLDGNMQNRFRNMFSKVFIEE